jgi:hypothetical protein
MIKHVTDFIQCYIWNWTWDENGLEIRPFQRFIRSYVFQTWRSSSTRVIMHGFFRYGYRGKTDFFGQEQLPCLFIMTSWNDDIRGLNFYSTKPYIEPFHYSHFTKKKNND